jgi:hypothetical protein
VPFFFVLEIVFNNDDSNLGVSTIVKLAFTVMIVAYRPCLSHYATVWDGNYYNGMVTPREVSLTAKKPKRFLLSPQREVMTKRFETKEVSIERPEQKKR